MAKDKPVEITMHYCKFCGAGFDESGYARNCMRSHLHAKDLRIKGLSPRPDELFYEQQERLPDCLLIGGTEVDEEAIYVRAGSVLRRPRGGDKRKLDE